MCEFTTEFPYSITVLLRPVDAVHVTNDEQKETRDI